MAYYNNNNRYSNKSRYTNKQYNKPAQKPAYDYKCFYIVGERNMAVIASPEMMAQEKFNRITADTTMHANLAALKKVLEKVPTNDEIIEKPFNILVPSMLKGFAIGTYVEYIRTGKTASGKDFTAEEQELIKEVVSLYSERLFNVRITEQSNDEHSSKAWEYIKSIPDQQVAPKAQPQQDPVALIGLQIAEAAAAGDMDKVMALTTALNALKAAQSSVPQAPVANDEEDEEYDEEETNEGVEQYYHDQDLEDMLNADDFVTEEEE